MNEDGIKNSKNEKVGLSEPGHKLPPYNFSAGSYGSCPGSEYHESPLMDLASALTGLGKPLFFFPKLAAVFGLKESVFICNFAWWTGSQSDESGWIYKTIQEIEDETALTKEEQMRLRKRLVETGILEEKDDRLNHRKFYRLNFDKLNSLWATLSPQSKKPTSRSRENPLGGVGNPDLGELGKPTPSIIRDTSETLHTNPEDPETENGHSVPFQCLEIYGNYPRRVGKPKALIAIRKALSKTTFEDLLAKTKAFAAARAGQDEQFTPHPSTWFHQERWNDDPSTWAAKTHVPQIDPQQEIRILQERINTHPANPESTYHVGTPTPEQKTSLRGLRARLRAVQDGLIKI